jgi:hypothetical protein
MKGLEGRIMLDVLERLVDERGLMAVLEGLAGVCQDKAEHIRTGWQDKPLAKAWEQMSGVLYNAAAKAGKLLP